LWTLGSQEVVNFHEASDLYRNVGAVRELVSETEERRKSALSALEPQAQSRLGQFFTPAAAADLIAQVPRLPNRGTLKVLDPGAGVGSLSAALVARVAAEAPDLKIHITAVETDTSLIPTLRETLKACTRAGSVTFEIIEDDFIYWSTGSLEHAAREEMQFDLVIMNPPYAKLPARSMHRKALQMAGVDCPNLYAAFFALGHRGLVDGGQIVAIIPRSFANGPYFKTFRVDLLSNIAIDRIHSFESRGSVFSDTGVLQENVIVAGTRGAAPEDVLLSFSHSHLDEVTCYAVPYSNVVDPRDPHQFIRIAIGAEGSFPSTASGDLRDLGLTVSTGRVVDFRSRELLVESDSAGAVPLIYPGNVRGGAIEWPRDIRKAQGFLVADDSARKLLMPPGRYVIIKRFSAKEERRRIVAAVWEGDGPVAFENHLNVIHEAGGGLSRNLAIGLSLWLNSTPVDKYFRTFSGHTQVNATDIRMLPFPSRESLESLGQGQSVAIPPQEELDRLIGCALGSEGEAA
jgi:adenine-specific DNA-methyltransferase